MTDKSPVEVSDVESVETVFSRDDWRPETINRGQDAGVLKPGDVLFGAYEITGKLGEGGMGAVYSAKHISLGGLRAIKVMNPTLSSNEEAVERFQREAKALLDVHHPAVVRCHDLLRNESGSIFLVMELIEGIPLSERLKDTPLNEQELRQLAVRLGGGLAAAHAQGVIHRDVAPDNIVLPEGRMDRAKLVDFGIAKMLRTGEQTMTAGFKGKLAYASPEQLGFFDGEIGPGSDFFSLALVLCGAAAGKRMDMGKNFATAVEARRKPISIPNSVPKSLRSGLQEMLILDPSDRPRSIDGLFDLDRSWSSNMSGRGIGMAAGLILGIGVGAVWLQGEGWPFLTASPAAVQPLPESIDVASPMPVAETMQIGESEETLQLALEVDAEVAALEATRQLFEDLRSRLIGARSSALIADANFAVSPNPVQHHGSYSLEISADCSCYPLVFFIDANTDQIDLLYPNPNDPIQLLTRGETFRVPALESNYTFEAEAGTGIDRLKLILLPERVDFPLIAKNGWGSIHNIEDLDVEEAAGDDLLAAFLGGSSGGDEFWSASPTQPENLGELASLLDGLDQGTWSSVETILHVIR